MNPTVYLTEKQLAEQLNVPVATLRTWRARSEGPPYTKLGPRAIRYSWPAVMEYLARRTKSSAA